MSAVFFKHSSIGLGWQVISVNTGWDMPVICIISKSKTSTMRKFDVMEARLFFSCLCLMLLIKKKYS